MRFIKFIGGNGYCGCDIKEYEAFEDETRTLFFIITPTFWPMTTEKYMNMQPLDGMKFLLMKKKEKITIPAVGVTGRKFLRKNIRRIHEIDE